MVKKLENIGFYTLNDSRAKNVSLDSPLWRCELLLTDRCNFSCPYCRGPNQYTKGELSFEEARYIIYLWSLHGLKNIRFSGGEPTLVDYLVKLVHYTKFVGVKRIALSTNGSADTALYEDLLNVGVNDFSISLDACCASTGDMMTGGIKGAWDIVKENIKFLSKYSYVTVGVVLTDDNFNELADIIVFASSLGVSDIRIISSAQWNNEEKFKNLFNDTDILTKYPILNYRIKNFRNEKNVRGIKEDDCNRCWLALDDMSIAGNYHFPCVIAMREGAEPVGTIDNKTMTEIRRERLDWIKENKTNENNICKRNCLDVCVEYNNKVRELNDCEKLIKHTKNTK